MSEKLAGTSELFFNTSYLDTGFVTNTSPKSIYALFMEMYGYFPTALSLNVLGC